MPGRLPPCSALCTAKDWPGENRLPAAKIVRRTMFPSVYEEHCRFDSFLLDAKKAPGVANRQCQPDKGAPMFAAGRQFVAKHKAARVKRVPREKDDQRNAAPRERHFFRSRHFPCKRASDIARGPKAREHGHTRPKLAVRRFAHRGLILGNGLLESKDHPLATKHLA